MEFDMDTYGNIGKTMETHMETSETCEKQTHTDKIRKQRRSNQPKGTTVTASNGPAGKRDGHGHKRKTRAKTNSAA
jgi:hypothetical protein